MGGDILVEFVLRPFLEAVVGWAACLTGGIAISVLSLGKIGVEPFPHSTERRRERGKRRGISGRVGVSPEKRVRMVRAEIACLAGFGIWVCLGLAAWAIP